MEMKVYERARQIREIVEDIDNTLDVLEDSTLGVKLIATNVSKYLQGEFKVAVVGFMTDKLKAMKVDLEEEFKNL